MPGGRPTSYSEEILEKARNYADNYKEHGDVVPSVAGLAVHLGISRETIYDWSSQESKKEFSDIVKGVMSRQELELMSGGLSGKFNPTIAKLMMTKHGYSDKQEVDQNIKGEVQFVNGVPRPIEGNNETTLPS